MKRRKFSWERFEVRESCLLEDGRGKLMVLSCIRG